MRVAIIGAGPAGITAACQLSRHGVPVVVFEKENQVGGLSRTIQLWGQKVDLGPHRFFTTHPRVRALWFQSVGDAYDLVNRKTRILYRGRFFEYPLQPANVVRNLGLTDSIRCSLSYFRQQIALQRPQEATFESWVSERFGTQLYEKFFKTYSEKLWGIPCTELDADFAVQRIRSFSLWQAFKSAAHLSANGHRTLVDVFAYPTGGAGMAYERMAAQVEKSRGMIRTGCCVEAVVRDGTSITGLKTADGSYEQFDHVISTMELPNLLGGFQAVPEEVNKAVSQLAYRNTIIVYLCVDSDQLFPDQWIYVHSPELEVGRITNFRNWVPELHGNNPNSIVAFEYWCYDRDPVWNQPDDQLIRHATDEFNRCGLAGSSHVVGGKVERIRGSYPVYRTGYKTALKPIIEFLSRLDGLTVIGRSGAFKYNNQDHSMLMGLMAAENFIHGASHDLWRINTEDEYQESGNAADFESGTAQPQRIA